MASDNKKPKKNDPLEEALREFEGSGGFSGKSGGGGAKRDEFEDDFEELKTSHAAPTQEDDDYIEYDEHQEEEIDQDFDVMNDEDLDSDDTPQPKKEEKKKKDKPKKAEDTSGVGGGSPIVAKLKEPKNVVMLIIAVCFVAFLFIGGDDKDKKKQKNESIEDEIASEVSDLDMMASDVSPVGEVTPTPVKPKKTADPADALKDIELPNLEIRLPDIKQEDVDLVPKIPEPKLADDKADGKADAKSGEKKDINVQEIQIRDKDDKIIKKEDPALDFEPKKKKREPMAKKDGAVQKPLITDFTNGADVQLKQKNKKNAHDFIFMDTDLDVEKEDEKSVISATRIQNPENVVSQGRIIDAVLETAVNSSISGQVRAIVTRDVYAEVGRNVLVPKGTRLYGEYGAASTSASGAAGSGANVGGRIVIKWSRIMRPDNVSASIDSYASDQFGRSGVSGQVDSNYIGGIASSVLLSTIPLVTTIVANAITNTNPQTVTVGASTGSTTVVQDPVNIATQAFTKSVGTVIADITKNAINTQPIITLDQGTRVKVLVNKDIKLPTYKPLVKASSAAFSE